MSLIVPFPCPPKAEARGSNPFGCAIINVVSVDDLTAIRSVLRQVVERAPSEPGVAGARAVVRLNLYSRGGLACHAINTQSRT